MNLCNIFEFRFFTCKMGELTLNAEYTTLVRDNIENKESTQGPRC